MDNGQSGGLGSRIEVVDGLRGLAALAVCWAHFTHLFGVFPDGGWIPVLGVFGRRAVEIFFVISGFILPWSLARSGYHLRAYPIYVAKRLVRIDPPYLLSVLLVLVLTALTAMSRGQEAPIVPIAPALGHLGYLNGLLGMSWFNPVYWSLAIEFQFYLLIGLLFPLVAHARSLVAGGTLAALVASSLLVPSRVWLFTYLGLIGLGVVAFHLREGRLTRWRGVVLMGAVASTVIFALGPKVALTGLVTGLLIAFVDVRLPGWLRFCGAISYSLYLVHLPVGGRVMKAGAGWAATPARQLLLLAAAYAASLAAAWWLYRFAERPALRWARQVRYDRPLPLPWPWPWRAAKPAPLPPLPAAGREVVG